MLNQSQKESHQLSRTSYGQANSQFTPVPTSSNAFGDESDSEGNNSIDDERDQGEPEFDAYKDFNNSGVRYVTLLNNGQEHGDERDPELAQLSTSYKSEPSIIKQEAPVELLQGDNRSGQLKSSSRTREKGPPTKKQFRGWRLGAVIAFFVIVILGVGLFLVIPRQPFISYETPVIFVGQNDSAQFHSEKPTQFSFDAQLQLSLDGRDSYLPTRLSNLKVIVKDLGSSTESIQVGKGSLSKSVTVGTKGLTPLAVDVHFEYSASASTDSLYSAWRSACGSIEGSRVNGTITRPALQLYLSISFVMLGAINTKSDSTQLNGVSCPVEVNAS